MARTRDRWTGSRRRSLRRRPGALIAKHAATRWRIVDVSADGMSIESGHGWFIGERYRLEIHDDRDACVIHAVVRWCRLLSVGKRVADGDSEPVFRTGFQFVASPPPSKRLP